MYGIVIVKTSDNYSKTELTLRYFSELQLLMDTDKNRFYRVQTQDSLTVVVASQVTLNPRETETETRTETGNFISRTVPRENVHAEIPRENVHAEKAAIGDISAWLSTKDPTKYTEISLTMMATSSPCLDCQPRILDMLKNWIERFGFTVKYKLRISSLYHGKAPHRLKSAAVEVQLADWKKTIQDSGVEFTLQPIAVYNEISLPNLETRQVNRDEVLHKRRKKDKKKTIRLQITLTVLTIRLE